MLPIRLIKNRTNDLFPEPTSSWARWPQDFEGLIDRMFPTSSCGGFRVDVHEEGTDLLVEAELPGLSKEDLEITVEDGVLTIAGEFKSGTEENEPNYHLRERRYGRVSRSFSLPTTVDSEKVEANLTNGVLTVRIPKCEEAKPKRIEVK